METHTHSSCCHHAHKHENFSWAVSKWLISFFFIAVIFYAAEPFIIKQLFNRASSYLTYDAYTDAIRIYQKILLMDKKNSDAWNMLGFAYKEKGDLKEAVDIYRRAAQIDPGNKLARFSLALMLSSEKKYKEAIVYLEEVRAFGPDSSEQIRVNIVSYHKSSLRLLAVCYEALKEYEKKDEVLKEWQRYYPKNSMTKNRSKEGRSAK